MKLMSYNILNGGRTRIHRILKVIKREAPDFLAIQEANGFDRENGLLLKHFAYTLQLPYFALAPAAKYGFPVASFSRYSIQSINRIKLLQNACLITEINCPLGIVTIANAHPYPGEETKRLIDIRVVLGALKQCDNVVLTGDMNSLSPDDTNPPDIIEKFNSSLQLRFTRKGVLTYKAIARILNSGFVDVAVRRAKNHLTTAPNGFNLHEDFTIGFDQPPVRIDYFFLSSEFARRAKNYAVIRTEESMRTSDHFPITLTFS